MKKKNDEIRNIPEKKFRVGLVTATIWRWEKNEKVLQRTISLQRDYETEQKYKWDVTDRLRMQDLPKAVIALQKAYEFMSNESVEFFKHDSDEDLDYCPECGEVLVFNKCRNGC